MELEVIRHKTAGDFFRDFSSAEEEGAYSYQLQRMFESGAAREGDYFVVRDGGIPYLRVEIFRNNTRRLWEKEPDMGRRAEADEAKIGNALDLIFEFLDDELYYPRITDALEISLKSEDGMAESMEKMCIKHGYGKYSTLYEYELRPGTAKSSDREPNENFKDITGYDPETRFGLVASHDPACTVFQCGQPDKIYQDYLDDSYLSEQNWKVIADKGKLSGYFMPSFTSGLKNTLRLNAYSLPENPDVSMCNDIISEMLSIAEENKTLKIELPVREEDAEFRHAVEMCGGILKDTIRKFAKNAVSV
ncbi:MAG: hypothetical protein AB7V07_00660 [Candidatus Delongbacteria bacterium]